MTDNKQDGMYWRYKKQKPPVDEYSDLNGPVKVSKLPHPFKCSKCDYVGQSKPDVNEHWSLEH